MTRATRADPRLAPCGCGGAVSVSVMDGGIRGGDPTAYAIECGTCKRREEGYPGNGSGRLGDAIAEWNRKRRRAGKPG